MLLGEFQGKWQLMPIRAIIHPKMANQMVKSGYFWVYGQNERQSLVWPKNCYKLTHLIFGGYPHNHLDMRDMISKIFEAIKSLLGLLWTYCWKLVIKIWHPWNSAFGHRSAKSDQIIFFLENTPSIHLWKHCFYFQNFFWGKPIMEIFKKWLCQ